MSAFDAFTLGERIAFGAHSFTTEEVLRFARAYDPQRFHVDEAEAARTHFGRLCASGWHTASVMMRLMVDHFARGAETAARRGGEAPRLGPSPGFDDLRWLRPVYPGDTITFAGEVIEKRRSQSRPAWGIVTIRTVGVNQAGEDVFAITGRIFAPADGPAA
jgi:acyl dehydratase